MYIRKLGNNTLQVRKTEHVGIPRKTEHVGIPIDSELKLDWRIEKAYSNGRKCFHAIVNMNSTDRNDFSPIRLAKLYKTIVLPTVLYGWETWTNRSKRKPQDLNLFQHYVVKKIQQFPVTIRSDIAECLPGLFRITVKVDRRKLRFLHKVISIPTSTTSRQLSLYRLYKSMVNTHNSHVKYGFIPDTWASNW